MPYSHIRGRVLIVDDDREVAAAFSDLLQEYLFYARVADSPHEAMQELVLDRFDVVVTDWIMPEGGGGELLDFIRETAPSSSIIVYSGYRTADAECLDADQFVEKGVDIQPIRNAIERSVHKSRRSPNVPVSAPSSLYEKLFANLVENPPFDEHVAFVAEDENLAAEAARWLQRGSTTSAVIELDGRQFRDRGELGLRLYGRCLRANESRPRLERGCLDVHRAPFVLVRHAEKMTDACQTMLAETFASEEFSRIGSDRSLPFQGQLVLTANPMSTVNDELRQLIGTNWLELPELSRLDATSDWLPHLVREASRGQVGPATMMLLEKGALTRLQLKHVLACCNEATNEQMLEFETLGLPVFESQIFQHSDNGRTIRPWREMKQIARQIYLWRTLSEAEGSVAKAASLSGLGRNIFYEAMRSADVTAKDFRRDK